MTVIRVYRLRWSSKDWPFAKEEFLAGTHNVKFKLVETAALADLVVTEKWGRKDFLKNALNLRRKPTLLWTDEPRYDTCIPSGVAQSHAVPERMNCFTGDVFHDIYRFLLYGETLPFVTPAEMESRDDVAPVLALMTYREGSQWSLRRNGVEHDLSCLRSRWAVWGHRNGVVDVCGRHWPSDSRVIEDSRQETGENQFAGWWERKQQLLKAYRFNFALENTIAPNYVTEKLWDSIRARSLPIYWGQAAVDSVFPEDSYIDCRAFSGPERLFAYINRMSSAEIAERVNRCIEVYNDAVQSSANESSSRKTERLLIERCLSLIGATVDGSADV
ncbi:Glycosyltransferase family 10 (fucosyltransferase) [Rosistilla oblonga]|uniref:glycosyltransferase family 10 domain-containing protein n=1 Tax=Rosistilla oblonga TaxID=2527990 RepID=UPI00118AD519|nr:glycosyltransferase family 10 [Rosistilla oblonga]QDV14249.1 Glycosyltransferase family 10 (fucosyltransferase) [Rosistilla oblonga]